MNYHDFGLFIVLFSCSVAISVGCDGDGLLECSETYAAKLREVQREIQKDGNSEAGCRWAKDYIKCLQPHLEGCPKDKLDQLQKAFTPFNKEPLNCNVAITTDGVCDGEGLKECALKFVSITPDISEKMGEKRAINAACKWARNYVSCLSPYARGCAQDQRDILNNLFTVFNEDPFNCDVYVAASPGLTATVMMIVFAALSAILM